MFFQEAASSGGFFYLVPLVVFFPAIGLLLNIIIGGRLPEKAIGWLASSASGLAFVIAVLQAISLLGHPEGTVIPLIDWIYVGDIQLNWAFQVDTLSVTMMLVVSSVGTLIHIYAIGYMHEDVRFNGDPKRYRRFFVFFNLFIFLMMVLVTADSYLMLFVGWEGVGLCSYLLIGFWYEKGKDGIGNAIAGKKAFVTNRIGDFGFLIAAFLMFTTFRTFNFEKVFEMAPQVAQAMPGMILAITLFMLLGVTGKSAQLPLFVWLPDAMAGPTPVSALIHAATMVTAGVYLVARSHVLYSLVPAAQNTVALVGGLTAFFAATIAIGQFDIKRVLAYSTISQLGYMVAAVGMGAFTAGMFHLVTHAFFKALLFLGAGSVIQGVEHGHHHVEKHGHGKSKPREGPDFDPQDMRNMGGLAGRMKITFWVYLIAAIAISGVPPLAGFWSKDEILAESSSLNPLVYWLLVAAAFLTAFYMGRQIMMVFAGPPRSESAANAIESPPVMTVPLLILAGLSLFGGALNLPGLHTFSSWLEHTFGQIHEGGFNILVALISSGLALLALFIAWYLYGRRYQAILALPAAKRLDDPLRQILGPIFVGMENKWWVDELYSAIIINPYKSLARLMIIGEEEADEKEFWEYWVHEVVLVGGFRAFTDFMALFVDLEIVDAFFNGMGELTRWVGTQLRRLQSGYVRNYALSVVLGVVIIVSYLILRR
jgi:NADH-quinone oxidoreductase subunit L